MSHLITSHKNTDAFIAFLEHLLLTCYPTDKLILVLDNAAYHKSRAALAALDSFAHRLRVVWLPTYSPYFNPIERFWLHLKNRASAHRLHTSLADLVAAIDQTIATHNDFPILIALLSRSTFGLLLRISSGMSPTCHSKRGIRL